MTECSDVNHFSNFNVVVLYEHILHIKKSLYLCFLFMFSCYIRFMYDYFLAILHFLTFISQANCYSDHFLIMYNSWHLSLSKWSMQMHS